MMNVNKHIKRSHTLALIFGVNIIINSQFIQSIRAEKTETPEEVDKRINNQAKTVVVRIFDFNNDNAGSGVFVKKLKLADGDRYFILTNAHVIGGEYQTSCNASAIKSKLKVETPDGRIYGVSIDPQSQNFCKKADLALLSFDGHKYAQYEVAKPKKSNLVTSDQSIYISGFPCSKNACEKIERFSIRKSKFIKEKKPFKFGYQIGYQADTITGMSGGGVFDRTGSLIGIHGQGKVSESGVATGEIDNVDPSRVDVFNKNSWAIPSEEFIPLIENIKTDSTTSRIKQDNSLIEASLDSINSKIQAIHDKSKEEHGIYEQNQFRQFLLHLLVTAVLILPLYKKSKNKD
jgi:S1-C subfamily serine protease